MSADLEQRVAERLYERWRQSRPHCAPYRPRWDLSGEASQVAWLAVPLEVIEMAWKAWLCCADTDVDQKVEENLERPIFERALTEKTK